MYIVVCTDLSCNEPHRQVGVDRVTRSRSLGSEMVKTLAPEA